MMKPPTWQPHTQSGVIYDLSHLEEYQTTFTNKGGTSFKVRVKFGHHCFTRAIEMTDTPEMIYQGSPQGDSRTFDLDRYTLSKELVFYISEFMSSQCYNTGNGKFFIIKIITSDGKQRDYEIYFRVYKPRNSKGLVLDIRSAFLRDLDRLQARSHQGKIHFGAILSNVQKGQQPKVSSYERKKIRD